MIRRALVLWLLPALALAGGASLSVTLPTQNTDGSAIPASGTDALNHIRFEWFQCATATATWPATPSSAQVSYPGTTYNVTNLSAGLWCFRAFAVNNGSVQSAPTGVATKQVLPATPNPPGNLTVASLTAYTSVKAVDRTVMLPVGTVPAATACIATEGIVADGITYHAVPRASVTFSGTVRPDLVWARCS